MAGASKSTGSQSDKAAAAQTIGARLTVQEPAEKDGDSTPRNRSRSNTRERSSSNAAGITRADLEATLGAGKGAWRITSAGIKSPMDFCYGLARGFHNAPKLYGDETVRKPEKITGFSSGLRAAGLGFAHGMGDGITGLLTQPMEAVKKEGPGAFLKGVGKGIGGLVFKPGAAIWGIPAYTSRGIYKELQKLFGPGVENYIIAARTAQGYEAYALASDAERAAIVTHWKELKRFIRKKRVLSDDLRDYHEHIKGVGERARALSGSRSPQPAAARADGKTPNGLVRTGTVETMDSGVYSPGPSSIDLNPLSRSTSYTVQTHSSGKATDADTNSTSTSAPAPAETETETEGAQATLHDAELEEAIRQSVAATSSGNAKEDAAIERAIRASVAELEAQRARGADDAALQTSMQDRLASAAQHGFQDPLITASLSDAEDDDDDDDDDGEDDAELQKALAQSKALHEQHLAADEEARREEEIVFKYMQRQSLAEEEMRQRQQQAGA